MSKLLGITSSVLEDRIRIRLILTLARYDTILVKIRKDFCFFIFVRLLFRLSVWNMHKLNSKCGGDHIA